MNDEIKKSLEKIAMQESYAIKMRGGLEAHDNDYDDYKEISVWSLQTMLERAYELGKSNA